MGPLTTTPASTAQPRRPDERSDDWLKRAIQQAFSAARPAGPQRPAS